MSTSIETYFENAQLSLAAYTLNLTRGMPAASYLAALTSAGMSDAQARRFAGIDENRNFTGTGHAIIDQFTDPSSGFSAVTRGASTTFACRAFHLLNVDLARP
jgi:hypothetical protein